MSFTSSLDLLICSSVYSSSSTVSPPPSVQRAHPLHTAHWQTIDVWLRRSWTPFVQLSCFTLVIMASYAVSVQLQPLKHAARFEAISLGVMVLVLYLSFFFVVVEASKDAAPTWMVQAVSVIVIILEIATIAYMAAVVVFKYRTTMARWGWSLSLHPFL